MWSYFSLQNALTGSTSKQKVNMIKTTQVFPPIQKNLDYQSIQNDYMYSRKVCRLSNGRSIAMYSTSIFYAKKFIKASWSAFRAKDTTRALPEHAQSGNHAERYQVSASAVVAEPEVEQGCGAPRASTTW